VQAETVTLQGRLIWLGEMTEKYARSLHRRSSGSMYTRKADPTQESRCVIRIIDRTPVRDRPGALGWGEASGTDKAG